MPCTGTYFWWIKFSRRMASSGVNSFICTLCQLQHNCDIGSAPPGCSAKTFSLASARADPQGAGRAAPQNKVHGYGAKNVSMGELCTSVHVNLINLVFQCLEQCWDWLKPFRKPDTPEKQQGKLQEVNIYLLCLKAQPGRRRQRCLRTPTAEWQPHCRREDKEWIKCGEPQLLHQHSSAFAKEKNKVLAFIMPENIFKV